MKNEEFLSKKRAIELWDKLSSVVDWSKIDKQSYLSAMERSPVNSLEIKTLLKEALTENIWDREVYMRGLQQSYYYEDLEKYNIAEL